MSESDESKGAQANSAEGRPPEGDAAAHDSGERAEADDGSGGEGSPGRKRKRRRRRGKKPRDESDSATVSAHAQAPAVAPASLSATVASLSAGLFSHLDDREEPCRVDGCDRTWTWTAQEQIQTFGQPPPRRMCGFHAEQLDRFEDREIECANPGCGRTWTLTKAAQIAQAGRTGSGEPPKRVCDECVREERQLQDRELHCRIDACKRTWTWSRDMQLKHRAWLRRHGDEPEPATADSGEPGGKRRRRRKTKRRGSIHEPPPRLCEPCKAKLARIEEREGPCKVHGCPRMAAVDKEQQLRAWVALGTDDLDAEAPLPRRMCESCRDFCRAHPDREVSCGRPGCDKTWTYKTGAQLQAMLAGRHEDPIRLCPECASGDFVRDPAAPPGTEVMPCVVPLCEGTWYWRPGTHLAPATFGDLPADRMCHKCKVERGFDVPEPAQHEPDASQARERSQSVNDPAPNVEDDREHVQASGSSPRTGSAIERPLESEDSLTADADV